MKTSEKRVMRKVEAGFCHSYPIAELGPREAKTAAKLEVLGFLDRKPAKGRFPERYVTTTTGSWAIGTFDSVDRYFHEDAANASFAARNRRAA